MADVNKIINKLLNDEKFMNSKSIRNKIYADQPLIKRASQIKTPETPAKIKEMKAIAFSSEAYWKTSAWLFYTQAEFMADFTDVYDYSEDFTKQYPIYSDLSTEQLRGYFSWRTRLRNGKFPHAPTPFVMIYACEIIHNIGVESPEKGFEILLKLYENYDSTKAQLLRLLADHAVYYRLSEEYLKKCPLFSNDIHLEHLINCAASSDEDVFSAIKALSGYNIEKSRFFTDNPEKFTHAAVRVFRRLSEFYAAHRKNSFCNYLFGKISETIYTLFDGVVFYDVNRDRTFDFHVNSIRSYKCRRGSWVCCGYQKLGSSKKLGEIIRCIDQMMRDRCEYKYKLNAAEIGKNIMSIISKELDEIEHEERKNISHIEIDISQLSKIRSDADITRDMLLTEEEITDEEELIEESADIPEKFPETTQNGIISAAEAKYLGALINGGDHQAVCREIGMIPSVMADNINERLFDIIGDTVIEFVDDSPQIIEDYEDDLRNLFKNGEL